MFLIPLLMCLFRNYASNRVCVCVCVCVCVFQCHRHVVNYDSYAFRLSMEV